MSTRCTLGPQFAPAFHRPFLRYIEGEQGGGDNGTGGAGGTNGAEQQPAFPANTPVKDMKPEEQAAYWQHQSRKHEGRAKAFGDLTPDQVKALQTENANLKNATQTDADKAIEAAREEGRNEVRAVLNRERAKTALDRALVGRVPDASALLDLDITKFVVNGKVDTDAVKAWVEDHSEESAGGGKRPNPDTGQGRRGSGNQETAKTVSAGRDLFAERHKKKTTTTTS